jgi:hypothetical protein
VGLILRERAALPNERLTACQFGIIYARPTSEDVWLVGGLKAIGQRFEKGDHILNLAVV